MNLNYKSYNKTPIWIFICTVIIISILAVPLIQASRYQRVQVVRIIDGDTIDVLIDGEIERVRYLGVNAPERDTESGKNSTRINEYLVGDYVDLRRDKSDRDRYGRLLRYVYDMDGRFINCELVEAGAAEVTIYMPDNKLAAQLWACAQ